MEQAVGPIPESLVLGDNATLIASIAPIYLTGSVLDVTYGPPRPLLLARVPNPWPLASKSGTPQDPVIRPGGFVRVAVILVSALTILLLKLPATHAGDRNPAYQRAHKAAVKYRRQRDDLQHRLTRRVLEVRALTRKLASRADLTPIVAIRLVFGPYADQAIRVSSCETGGTFSIYARNGQYLGLFQMGDYARGRYGHSWTILGQVQAAYRYFVESGWDWSPWECKP